MFTTDNRSTGTLDLEPITAALQKGILDAMEVEQDAQGGELPVQCVVDAFCRILGQVVLSRAQGDNAVAAHYLIALQNDLQRGLLYQTRKNS